MGEVEEEVGRCMWKRRWGDGGTKGGGSGRGECGGVELEQCNVEVVEDTS